MATHLITGAGSGIGAVLARTLLERGDDVLLVARSAARAQELSAELPGADVIVADLADPREAADIGVPDRLDGVVHSAGVVDVAPLADTDPASLELTLDVNLLAPMLLTQRLLEPVRRARGTHVFVNSGSGLRAKADWAAYNASKFGLRGFADALRQEEAGHGVRVSSVYPGRVATAMQERVHAAEGAEYDASAWIRPETVSAAIVRLLDLAPDATIPDVTISPTP